MRTDEETCFTYSVQKTHETHLHRGVCHVCLYCYEITAALSSCLSNQSSTRYIITATQFTHFLIFNESFQSSQRVPRELLLPALGGPLFSSPSYRASLAGQKPTTGGQVPRRAMQSAVSGGFSSETQAAEAWSRHLNLLPILWMHGAIPLLPHTCLRRGAQLSTTDNLALRRVRNPTDRLSAWTRGTIRQRTRKF